MFRYFAVVAAAMVCIAVAYFYISDITRKDVIAANAFTWQIQSEPLKAGDVVVVSDNGEMSRICDALVVEDSFALEKRSEVYFNRAQRIMSWTGSLASSVGVLDEIRAGDILRTSIPFIGKSSSLSGERPGYANPSTCECALARNLARGDKVCNVKASLIETSEVFTLENGEFKTRPVERTLAVALSDLGIFLMPQAYEACNVDFTDLAQSAGDLQCSSAASMPFDVKLRQYLNLIDSEPFKTHDG